MGVLGAVWIAATGSVANAAEVVAVWQADALSEQPQFVAAIWGMNVATFIALLLPWATFILGFSAAGRATGVLPPWIVGLGWLVATVALIGAIGIRSAMAGGFAEPIAIAAYSLIGLWVLVTSVLMILRSWRP
jgi:hypothetical protein